MWAFDLSQLKQEVPLFHFYELLKSSVKFYYIFPQLHETSSSKVLCVKNFNKNYNFEPRTGAILEPSVPTPIKQVKEKYFMVPYMRLSVNKSQNIFNQIKIW